MVFGRVQLIIFILFAAAIPCLIESLKCEKTGICVPAYGFDFTKNKNIPKSKSHKECDDGVCIAYGCVINNEKVMIGAGCVEDFEKYCPYAALNASSLDNETMILDSYRSVQLGDGFITASCNTTNCALSYLKSTINNEDYITVTFLKNTFISGEVKKIDSCKYVPTPTTTAPPPTTPSNTTTPTPSTTTTTTMTPTTIPSSGKMNQINGFILFGTIFLGLILAQFC